MLIQTVIPSLALDLKFYLPVRKEKKEKSICSVTCQEMKERNGIYSEKGNKVKTQTFFPKGPLPVDIVDIINKEMITYSLQMIPCPLQPLPIMKR